MRGPKRWALGGAVLLALGVLLPVLGNGVRIALIVAGLLLLLGATSRMLAGRGGGGDSRGPQDGNLPPDSWGSGHA